MIGIVEVFVGHVFEVRINTVFSALGLWFDVVRAEGDLISGIGPGSFDFDLLLLAFEAEQIGCFIEANAEKAVESVMLAVVGAVGAAVDLVDGELSGPLTKERNRLLVAAAGEFKDDGGKDC